MSEEAEYFSKDFEWEELREKIEGNLSFRHHFHPFESSPPSSSSSPTDDSDAWRSFHSRHSAGKFFKERRYLLKEFPELRCCDEYSKVLEVGCGNGSSVLPILRGKENVIVYACDCSGEALEKAEEIIDAASGVSVKHHFHTFPCDFSINGFPKWLLCESCQKNNPQKKYDCVSDVKECKVTGVNEFSLSDKYQCCLGGMDFITLIFTLSAVPFHIMPRAIGECMSVLKPGGLILFRDYGLYDMTMLRFEPKKRVGFREYMRSDGTRSYFFCLDTVRELFLGAGFNELELDYCCIKSVNRRNGKTMQRVWVHGKFQKPI